MTGVAAVIVAVGLIIGWMALLGFVVVSVIGWVGGPELPVWQGAIIALLPSLLMVGSRS